MEDEKGIWTTKDGKKIKISEIQDDHLINSIRLLRRVVRRMRFGHELSGFSMLNFVNGEMAELAIEQSLEQEAAMNDEEWLNYHTVYEELIEEAKRRDILIFIGVEFFKRMEEIERPRRELSVCS